MLPTIFFYTFLFVVVAQLLFYLFGFGSFSFSKTKRTLSFDAPVSVIIASKNEVENLKNNLPSILDQKYSNFEVIIINDASTDTSLEVIRNLQQQNKHLKLINIEFTSSYTGNKKNAISKGIEIASNDYLLFTDADCKPNSKYWISQMVSHFSDTKNIVLGYGAYKKNRSSFLNKLIRYETLLAAIQYFSYAKIGIPYMGVGRNLAYKKELFFITNGFESHKHIKSGDDDLFINQIATNKNTEICFTKNSFTHSEISNNITCYGV